jgi:hypothetical protein
MSLNLFRCREVSQHQAGVPLTLLSAQLSEAFFHSCCVQYLNASASPSHMSNSGYSTKKICCSYSAGSRCMIDLVLQRFNLWVVGLKLMRGIWTCLLQDNNCGVNCVGKGRRHTCIMVCPIYLAAKPYSFIFLLLVACCLL